MSLNPQGLKRVSRKALEEEELNHTVAVCTPSDPFGVNISFTHEGKVFTRWAKNITGKYICGVSDSWSQYTAVSLDQHAEGNPGGCFLVLFLALVLTMAFTGTWPMIFSLSLSVDSVKRKLDAFATTLMNMLQRSSVQQTLNIFNAIYMTIPEDQAAAFKEKVHHAAISSAHAMDRMLNEERSRADKEFQESGADSARKRRLALFSKIYMGISAVLVFAVSIAVAQLFCAYMKWPNLIIMVDSLKCYPLDTSRLPLGFDYEPSLQPDSNVSSLALPKRTTLEESYSNLNTAIVSINGDTALITSDCEATWVKLDDESRYVVLPGSKVICNEVKARKIGWGKSRIREKCGDSILYSMENKEPRLTGMAYTEVKSGTTVNSCKRKIWPITYTMDTVWEDELGFKQEDENWSYCQVVPQSMRMVKVDESGNVLEDVTDNGDFTGGLTVDPKSSYPYGWYTDGINELVPTFNFNDGIGSNLLFRERAELDEKATMQLLLDAGYFTYSDKGWNAKSTMAGPNVKPTNFQCKMQYTLRNIDKYRQVANPCSSVTAQLVDGTTTRFTTNDQNSCTVAVGFGSDRDEMSVTLKANSAISLLGPTSWRCASSTNGVGVSCTADSGTPMIPINPEGVNSSISIDVTNQGIQPSSETPPDLGMDFGSLFGSTGMGNLLSSILTIALVVAAIVICAKLGIFQKILSLFSLKKEASSSKGSRKPRSDEDSDSNSDTTSV